MVGKPSGAGLFSGKIHLSLRWRIHIRRIFRKNISSRLMVFKGMSDAFTAASLRLRLIKSGEVSESVQEGERVFPEKKERAVSEEAVSYL
mgnify:CR=1 FL=1